MSVATANTAGHTKKISVKAILLIGYCLGNFVGPFFLKAKQAPQYDLDVAMMFCCIALQIVCISGLWVLLWFRNKRRFFPETADEKKVAHESGFMDMTDMKNPYFKVRHHAFSVPRNVRLTLLVYLLRLAGLEIIQVAESAAWLRFDLSVCY